MKHIYLVEHIREDPDGFDDAKQIGIYSTREKAEQAVSRAMLLPGFAQCPEGFTVHRCEIDKDEWTTGFLDLSDETEEWKRG